MSRLHEIADILARGPSGRVQQELARELRAIANEPAPEPTRTPEKKTRVKRGPKGKLTTE